ncbi:EAL domain-containing protein [Lautropia mirabilis]
MFGSIRVEGRHGTATPTSFLWVSPVLEFLPDFHLSGVVVTSVLVVILVSHVALLLFFWRGRKALTKANLQLESANEELRRRAFIDPLTGLPNRMLFEDRLLHAMQRYDRDDDSRARREPCKLAVLFVDLDGFKPINDMLGHAVGDEVLKEAARRLRTATRDSDTVARIGGDEFVLLAEDVSDVADCASLANRVIQVLAQPLEVQGHQVTLSGSVGVALYPEHGDRMKLVQNADAAMYTAKRAGGNTYALFESRMNEGLQEQLSLQHDLRHALERGELQLHYQPKIDARLGRLQGVEALLRWHHPTRGMVGPNVFIPIAERFGLINGLGNWVIEESCRQMRVWADEGLSMNVAINLSVHQLRTEELVPRIESALARYQVMPSQLLCEITESVAMEDIESTQRAFEALSRIGVYLSIDDFGTGYSSLSYLRQLPARQLKIDRSFVADIEVRPDARAIVGAVIQLAHQLGLRVVAEGVETEGQRDILLVLQCDELQGYLLARPMAVEALDDWLQKQPSDEPPPAVGVRDGEAALMKDDVGEILV